MKRNTPLIRLVPVVLMCAVATSVRAGPQFGTKLGEVDFRQWESGFVLKLSSCADSKNKPVQEVKLVAKERRIQVDQMKVITHGGAQLTVDVDTEIRAGIEQEWRTLGDSPQCISLLRFVLNKEATYPSAPQKVTLEVWGR